MTFAADLRARVSDELLPHVKQPGQYIGGEFNQLVRDGGGVPWPRLWAAMLLRRARGLEQWIRSTRILLFPNQGFPTMHTVKFLYWQEDSAWIGYLQDYPDYWTQGETFDDLKEHLRDLYNDLTSGQLPGIRKLDELVVS